MSPPPMPETSHDYTAKIDYALLRAGGCDDTVKIECPQPAARLGKSLSLDPLSRPGTDQPTAAGISTPERSSCGML